ncbi:MAG: hypothetical protein AAGA23_08500 [Pseudomonadota bacterium]
MKRPGRRGGNLLVAVLLAGIVGCAAEAPRRYIDPTGSEAEACLQFCQGERFACRTPIQRVDEDCQYRYRIVYQQFQRCLQVRGERGGCVRPRPCPVPDYRICGEKYDRCFLGCGGQILEPGESAIQTDSQR